MVCRASGARAALLRLGSYDGACHSSFCLLLTGACVRCHWSASTLTKLATLIETFRSRECREFCGITSRPRGFRTASAGSDLHA